MSKQGQPPENLPGAEGGGPPPTSASRAPSSEPAFDPSLAQTEAEKPQNERNNTQDPSSDPTDTSRQSRRDLLIVGGIFVAVVLLYILNVFLLGDEVEPRGASQPTSDSAQISKTRPPSLYQGWIELASGTAGSARYPQREYVTIDIVQENLSYLFVSEWQLVGPNGERYELDEAAPTPKQNQPNEASPIVVEAGQKIIVSSGDSPIGVSFRQNACSGYLEQFQNFVPAIARSCPDPTERMPREIRNGPFSEDTCADYIESLPKCQALTEPPAGYLSPTCQQFVEDEISYNACVDTYKESPGFASKTWRVYLGEDNQIWKESGTITLLDGKGAVVDEITY